MQYARAMRREEWSATSLLALFAGLVAYGIFAAPLVIGVVLALVLLLRTGMARQPRSTGILLCVYLIPLIALGRVWAAVGFSPLYVPDLLAILAAVCAVPTLVRQLGKSGVLRWYGAAVLLLALLTLPGLREGETRGYPAALKYSVMAVYPLLSVAIGAWLLEHPGALGALSRLLPWAGVGAVLVVVGHLQYVPASYGLYLGVTGAAAATVCYPRRVLLAGACLLGLGFLAQESSRRGILLTALLAATGAWVASNQLRRGRSRVWPVGLAAVSVGIITALAVVLPPSHWPVVGGSLSRLGDTFTAQTNAGNNAAIRQQFWQYALHTAASNGPWLGVGAGHYIGVDFMGNNVSTANLGVHNSFVGYAFYFGFPAAAIVVGICVMALWRTWRYRGEHPYAPMLLGATVAVIATAMTNVALETPYIAGPSWFLLSAAILLPGVSRVIQDDQGTTSTLLGHAQDRHPSRASYATVDASLAVVGHAHRGPSLLDTARLPQKPRGGSEWRGQRW